MDGRPLRVPKTARSKVEQVVHSTPWECKGLRCALGSPSKFLMSGSFVFFANFVKWPLLQPCKSGVHCEGPLWPSALFSAAAPRPSKESRSGAQRGLLASWILTGPALFLRVFLFVRGVEARGGTFEARRGVHKFGSS